MQKQLSRATILAKNDKLALDLLATVETNYCLPNLLSPYGCTGFTDINVLDALVKVFVEHYNISREKECREIYPVWRNKVIYYYNFLAKIFDSSYSEKSNSSFKVLEKFEQLTKHEHCSENDDLITRELLVIIRLLQKNNSTINCDLNLEVANIFNSCNNENTVHLEIEGCWEAKLSAYCEFYNANSFGSIYPSCDVKQVTEIARKRMI